METFTEAKPFISDPDYLNRREKALKDLERELERENIDAPLIEMLQGYNSLPYCFTLQSCYGHFVYEGQTNPKDLKPLPATETDLSLEVEYRIAYMAICLQNNNQGRRLFQELRDLTGIDPGYVQFGSAEWFWKRCVNSYALQVEPERYKDKDKATISMKEALHVEKVRNGVFQELKNILEELQ